MKSNSISLEDELQTLDKKCKLLLRGEWISLVLSGVGTVVTAFTNQAVFAATPLTFSLFLNILSRSHQDKKVYDQSSQNLIEIQRQYASKIQGLRSEFLGVDFTQEEAEGYSRSDSFEELAAKVKQLESFLEIQGGDYYSQGGAINQEVSILRNHQLEMAEAIETLTTQLETQAESSLSQGDVASPHDIQDHLDRLSAAVYELERKTSAFANGGSENGNALGLGSPESDLHDKLEPLQSQLSVLEERMNVIATADPAYDPEALHNEMQVLIKPIHDQLSSLEERLQTQPAEQGSADSSGSVDPERFDGLAASIGELQSRLDHSITQISADIGEFQESLQKTHEQIDQVHVRMNSIHDLANGAAQSNPEEMQKQVEAMNAPLQTRLTEIQEQLGEINLLQAQIDQVRELVQQSSESLNPEIIQARVNEATAPLMEKISSVEAQVQTQGAGQNFSAQLHQFIEPLQSHMVSLEQRINQLSSEGDRTPLLNKVAALQGQLQTVEARLEQVPTQVVDHSSEIHQLADKVADMQNRLESVSQSVSQDLAQMPQVIEEKVEEKSDFLSELQALSFEEEITASNKAARSELDSLLDSLDF